MRYDYHLTLTSDLKQIEKVTVFVEMLSAQIRCDSETEHRIMLTLTEAATNAIIHGNRENPDLKVQVHAWYDPDMLQITVKDQGRGFEPKSIPDPRADENLLKLSGRGILLMRELADHVSFTEGGRCVKLQFYFKN